MAKVFAYPFKYYQPNKQDIHEHKYHYVHYLIQLTII